MVLFAITWVTERWKRRSEAVAGTVKEDSMPQNLSHIFFSCSNVTGGGEWRRKDTRMKRAAFLAHIPVPAFLLLSHPEARATPMAIFIRKDIRNSDARSIKD